MDDQSRLDYHVLQRSRWQFGPEIFFEHWRNKEEFKTNISPDFSDEPIGTNMDIDVLYDMFKNPHPLKSLFKMAIPFHLQILHSKHGSSDEYAQKI